MARNSYGAPACRESLACLTFVTAVFAFLLIPNSYAAEPCNPAAGQVASVEGKIEIQRGVDGRWMAAKLKDTLCEGDSLRAAERSRATIALANQAVFRIDQNSTIRLTNISNKPEERSFLKLLKGAIQSFSRKPRQFEVSTPYLNGTIEGTEFVIRVTENQTILTVFEGTVRAANEQGTVSVPSGQSVAADAGKAPQPRTMVRPRDAAQWSLYYPPVLAAGDAKDQNLQQAAQSLSVGRIDNARTEIDKALSQDPKSGVALALRSIIHVVQNDKAQALVDANQAVALSPDASSPRIALSYAQQAHFQIPQARDTLLEAVKRQPEDALAWARLAELQLMLGNRDRAVEAAQKATALAPDLARTQITLGFVALTEFRTDDAKAVFERAINLNSADPLPRLGLGLARISAGKLEEGRRDLEVAVALDGNSALLRAYLGKAYFDEKRRVLDREQFAIAKDLDPLDPTAFLYDAIRKQTENQPVDALHDVEDAIERNDNRAAYRGRLLLDKDRAARGTSLARVYSDLGFVELGINESTKSLALDPADASAHRFLSDAYQNVRRREIARVSELLQAQMLQDVNITPVQPSLSETSLNVVTLGGPANAGFNEFTPLFQRNQAQGNVAVFGGNNSTVGGEAVVSATQDRYSVSVGAFTYRTDGWRLNNGLEQQVYNAFMQAAITDKLNVQAEFMRRKSTEGDLAFNFDPDEFSTLNTKEREQYSARIGLRYSPSPFTHILLSAIHGNYEEQPDYTNLSFPPYVETDMTKTRLKGNQIEGQVLHQESRFNLIVGAAHTRSDRRDQFNYAFINPGDPFDPFNFIDTSTYVEGLKQPRGYVYSNINVLPSLKWTVGASYDAYEEGTLEVDSFNPKLGVQWDVNNNLRFRAAGFKVVKPALVNNRTLEPTQVAGFNQLFDDINGTKSERYAVGADLRLSRNLAAGAETSVRKLEEPTFDGFIFDWIFEKREEQFHRLYLNWTPTARLAVRTELVSDRYESEAGPSTDGGLPELVKTVSLPIGVTYFDPSGIFIGFTATAVDQEVIRNSFFTPVASGDDQFTVLDAVVGYRFSGRRGIASLGVMNLFDRKFNYQDDSYREFRTEPSVGPYFPVRTVMGRVSLNF